jgi:tetratricopeptide (TPR) repeat protein
VEDGRRILEKLEAQLDGLEPVDQAHAINLIGRFAQIQGDNSPATIGKFEESLALYREAGYDPGVARALMNLGNARSRDGLRDDARQLFEDALQLYKKTGDSFGAAGALMNLGDSYLGEGDIDKAETYFREARDIAHSTGNKLTLAFVSQYLGVVARQRNELATAERLHKKGHALFEELGAQTGIMWSQFYLAGLARSHGEWDRARDMYLEVFHGFRELRLEGGTGSTLSCLAGLEADAGRLELGVRLLGAANRILETVTITRSTLERDDCERLLEAGRTEFGEESLEKLLTEGRDLDLDTVDQLVRSQTAN